MKPGPLVALIALAWAFEGNASAQAITSTVQLTQQSMDSTKSASKKQSVHIYGGEVQQAAPTKPGSVQAFYNVNRLNCNCAKQPVLSMNPGQIAFGTQVTLTSPSTNATIYYTTDGWTPTNASNRYIGPISIVGNTRLQAIAEEPGLLPSPIVEASYTVDAPPVPLQPNALAVGTVLVKGTPLRLITVSRTSSKSAAVGDRLYLLLDQNIVSGGVIVAPRGMSVEAKILTVEHAGTGGKSGVLIFQVQSFSVHGVPVLLNGVFTLVAPDIGAQSRHIANPSLVRVSGPLPPGNESQIEPGMTLVASVAADATLNP